jgi:hypothetical protein
MKKLVILTFLFAFVFTSVNATVAANKKDVLGNWKYEVPTAPVGYDKGVMVISEKEGKLIGEVKFADGYKIDLKEVTYEEGVVKCSLYVDYNLVTVKAKIEGKKLTGTVNTPEGDMKISAEKE